MKNLPTPLLALYAFVSIIISSQAVAQSKQTKFPSRAPVAVRQSSSAVYTGWRMPGNDTAVTGAQTFDGGEDSSQTLSIRPNPVDNAAYISYNSDHTRLILVVAAGDGRVVFRRTGSITELNNGLNAVIGAFPRGIYVVQLKDKNHLLRAKMVKQ